MFCAGKALQSQMESMRVALTKLMRVSDMLNESLDITSSLDALSVNEKAAAELKLIRATKLDLVPCHEDGIVFIPPDLTLLRVMSSLGSLSVSPNGLQLPHGRIKELQIALPRLVVPKVDVENGTPRGRPILNVPRPVVVRKNEKNVIALGAEGERTPTLFLFISYTYR